MAGAGGIDVATSSSQQPTRVAIAIVGRAGSYLVRQRPAVPGSPMPGRWEFPGGKCEASETPEKAVLRECLEETGLVVRILGLRRVIRHTYPHGFVELYYFDCDLVEPAREPPRSSGFGWVAAVELPALDFPEANGPILDELAKGVPSGPASG
jgi:8-oxo-dGTP diphosphatase